MNTCSGNSRTTRDKIRLFRSRFSGLSHVYGTYDPESGRSWQVKQAVSDRVVFEHLCGRHPYGVYLLQNDVSTAFVADFDNDVLEDAIALVQFGREHGIPLHVERSKSKGYHVWMFAQKPVSAKLGRSTLHRFLYEMKFGAVEVFPKQDRIDVASGAFGNFINAPLFGRLVPDGRTVFLDPEHRYRPFPNQWDFLEAAEPVSLAALQRLVPARDDHCDVKYCAPAGPVLGVYEGAGSLPPCARTMLEQGVTEYQRVACFRLAVNLRRVGLDFNATVAVLTQWAARNRPVDGKRLITSTEVRAQAAHAYLKRYEGFGCDDPAVKPFCAPHCPVLRRGTTETADSSAPL